MFIWNAKIQHRNAIFVLKMNRTDIKISDQVLELQDCVDFVSDDGCGGITTFVGTVRNDTSGKEVKQLDFSTYKPMALKEMQKIADKALEQFEIHKIAIHHAEGMLQISDIPVIIAASAKHRKAAFLACEFAIDTLKETVPIWKKEYFTDGEVWVNAHP